MSSLRQPAQDAMTRDYKALVEICKADIQSKYRQLRSPLHQMTGWKETERVKEMIGTEEEFRAKFSDDKKYKAMVNLVLDHSRVRRQLTYWRGISSPTLKLLRKGIDHFSMYGKNNSSPQI